MNSNIEKILSISAGALFVAIAFTVFFSNYKRHIDYINGSKKVFEEDIMADISEAEQECRLTGSEIIHIIIDRNANKEIRDLQTLYVTEAATPFEEPPEVWIDGNRAELMDFTGIDPARYYHVHYDTDSDGNIIKIEYSTR